MLPLFMIMLFFLMIVIAMKNMGIALSLPSARSKGAFSQLTSDSSQMSNLQRMQQANGVGLNQRLL